MPNFAATLLPLTRVNSGGSILQTKNGNYRRMKPKKKKNRERKLQGEKLKDDSVFLSLFKTLAVGLIDLFMQVFLNI